MTKDCDFDFEAYYKEQKEEIQRRAFFENDSRMDMIKYLILCESEYRQYTMRGLIKAVVEKNAGTRPTEEETRIALDELLRGVW